MLPQAAERIWRDRFEGEPACLASAPGRVNLIGEHTDYNEGFVFPAAIGRRTYVLARKAASVTKLISGQAGQGEPFRIPEGRASGWAKYAAGCAKALAEHGAKNLPNMEGVVWSDIPNGSGLSSSAALELALLGAWNELAGLSFSAHELARIGWRAETAYVGVQCGIMDQMASALGKAGNAIFIDTRSEEYSYWPIPDGLSIAVLDTRKPRSLAASAYNQRVRECAAAVEALTKMGHQIASLRDADMDMLKSAKAQMQKTIYKRARHVITENRRTLAFRDALQSADRRQIKALCAESHESLRIDYEVSCPELDAMVRAASSAPGCVGVRLTGAGFGGCCVALVETDAYEDFEPAVIASYGMYGFPMPDIFATQASDGVFAQRLF